MSDINPFQIALVLGTAGFAGVLGLAAFVEWRRRMTLRRIERDREKRLENAKVQLAADCQKRLRDRQLLRDVNSEFREQA